MKQDLDKIRNAKGGGAGQLLDRGQRALPRQGPASFIPGLQAQVHENTSAAQPPRRVAACHPGMAEYDNCLAYLTRLTILVGIGAAGKHDPMHSSNAIIRGGQGAVGPVQWELQRTMPGYSCQCHCIGNGAPEELGRESRVCGLLLWLFPTLPSGILGRTMTNNPVTRLSACSSCFLTRKRMDLVY